MTIRRLCGYCKRCRKWRFPADTALGLEETAGYSPAVQEMEEVLASLPAGPTAEAVRKEVEYFHEHEDRMDYRAARRRGLARHDRQSGCRRRHDASRLDCDMDRDLQPVIASL